MTSWQITKLEWQELARFQVNIAKRWLARGNEFEDPFVNFFFYFAGYNALYFLWSRVDSLRNAAGGYRGDGAQIKHLLQKCSDGKASAILKEIETSVRFFRDEHRPIGRMNRRGVGGDFVRGDAAEGRRWRNKLAEDNKPTERLVALGQVLYIVRSNLIHGSKGESGDDRKIIEASVPVVQSFLRWAIEFTCERFGFEVDL